MKYFQHAADGKLRLFILVVEGAMPNKQNKKEGYWVSFGTNPTTDPRDRAWHDQYWVTLNGDLTIHGVTCSRTVSARVIDWNSLRAFGNFSLLQTDYDLKLASVAWGAH
jgi:hypothetical protein